MPRGWYLAQGFIPIGPSSSDDEEGPCELPNGRIVCGPHGLVSCGRCCSDYSFMDDVLGNDEEDEDEDEDEDESGLFDAEIREMYQDLTPGARAVFRSRYGSPPPTDNPCVQMNSSSSQGASSATASIPTCQTTQDEPQAIADHLYKRQEINAAVAALFHTDNDHDSEMPDLLDGRGNPEKRRGTGRVFPTRLSTNLKPTELFSGKANSARITRYIHHHDTGKVLIFTDGACLNNGQPNPKAGWAFVHGPGFGGQPAVISGRLESVGPFGDHSIQTSNRAELRAVIAALRFQTWEGEGFRSIVIATDSEYVTQGSTVWVKTWVKNGWQKNDNTEVKNKDLWEMLLGEAERLHDRGLSIQFWRIPRDLNEVADTAAKKAADKDAAPNKWTDAVTDNVAVRF